MIRLSVAFVFFLLSERFSKSSGNRMILFPVVSFGRISIYSGNRIIRFLFRFLSRFQSLVEIG